MVGVRQYNNPDETTVKLTVGLPVDLDRQLRALAAQRRIGVGPLVRRWIIDGLLEAPHQQKEMDDAAEAI